MSRFFPHWRKATWAIVIWTVLAILWIVAGASNVASTPQDCGVLDQATCDAATAAGAGIGITLILIIWFLGFIVLGLVWLMSRPGSTTYELYAPDGGRVLTANKKEYNRLIRQGWTGTPRP